MADPTLAELAARVAVIETRLGITPPAPEPAPTPAPSSPAQPTGLHSTMLADGRPQLDWDDDPDAAVWEVLDVLDTVTPIKDTVIVPRSIRSAVKAGTRRRYGVRAKNEFGTSPLSALVDVPPAAAPPQSTAVPASVLDLSRWYLTLPIADPSGTDTSGPWDVYQPQLATFSHPGFFRTGSDTFGRYVEYVVPAKGVSTSGSDATRGELREMAGPKPSDKASWSFDDGKTHGLTCTLTCDGTSIAGRKEVIVGQIHGPGGTPPLILCMNHTRGALEVFRQGPRQGDLLTGLQPAELMTYRFVAAAGRLKVWACRGDVTQLPAAAGFDWSASVLSETSGLYIKGGGYLKQEISSATTGAATVRHYRLDLV